MTLKPSGRPTLISLNATRVSAFTHTHCNHIAQRDVSVGSKELCLNLFNILLKKDLRFLYSGTSVQERHVLTFNDFKMVVTENVSLIMHAGELLE